MKRNHEGAIGGKPNRRRWGLGVAKGWGLLGGVKYSGGSCLLSVARGVKPRAGQRLLWAGTTRSRDAFVVCFL